MGKLSYRRVIRNRISRPAPDPHTEDIQWRYDGKWGLQLLTPGSYWSWSGAEQVIPTPERITLWYRLMREVVSTPKAKWIQHDYSRSLTAGGG